MNDYLKNKVSIIIPLYNSAAYIEKCIDSCLRQTHQNVELIIVDDGSTDDGLAITKNIAKNHKNVKVFSQKNNGVSSARNIGIEKSQGNYICFVDADDYIDKEFVATMLSHMERFDSDFCFSINTHEKNKRNDIGQPKVINSAEAETLLLSSKVKVGCWNKMYSRKILANIRFREDLFYGEGLYFINQVAHAANNIVVCEDGLYHYRKVNPDSATTVFDIKKMVNGEQSLLDIKELIKADGKVVNRMWSQHYCLFCINAMMGLISQKSKDYKDWHKKMKGNIIPALRSKGGFKKRIIILFAFFSPKLYNNMFRR